MASPARIPLKEVFVIHTKRSAEDRQLAEVLGTVLSTAGYSTYEYADWSWERRETRREYSWESGTHIDIERLALGDAPFATDLPHSSIDLATLDEILRWCRLIIVVSPRRRVTTGVRTEVHSMRRAIARRQRDRFPPPKTLCCIQPQQEVSRALPGYDAVVEVPGYEEIRPKDKRFLGGAYQACLAAAGLLVEQREQINAAPNVIAQAFRNRWFKNPLARELEQADKVVDQVRWRIEDHELADPALERQLNAMKQTIAAIWGPAFLALVRDYSLALDEIYSRVCPALRMAIAQADEARQEAIRHRLLQLTGQPELRSSREMSFDGIVIVLRSVLCSDQHDGLGLERFFAAACGATMIGSTIKRGLDAEGLGFHDLNRAFLEILRMRSGDSGTTFEPVPLR